jgi:hypothetical protein
MQLKRRASRKRISKNVLESELTSREEFLCLLFLKHYFSSLSLSPLFVLSIENIHVL